MDSWTRVYKQATTSAEGQREARYWGCEKVERLAKANVYPEPRGALDRKQMERTFQEKVW